MQRRAQSADRPFIASCSLLFICLRTVWKVNVPITKAAPAAERASWNESIGTDGTMLSMQGVLMLSCLCDCTCSVSTIDHRPSFACHRIRHRMFTNKNGMPYNIFRTRTRKTAIVLPSFISLFLFEAKDKSNRFTAHVLVETIIH